SANGARRCSSRPSQVSPRVPPRPKDDSSATCRAARPAVRRNLACGATWPGRPGCEQASGRGASTYVCAETRVGCRRGEGRLEFTACRDSEFREDAVEVGADRAVGQVEPLAYLLV